jgi:hypothetical protein
MGAGRSSAPAPERPGNKGIFITVTKASTIVCDDTAGIRNRDHFSPEIRAHLDKLYAEEARRYGRMLDAMLLEARNLRLVEGHKARERTLSS